MIHFFVCNVLLYIYYGDFYHSIRVYEFVVPMFVKKNRQKQKKSVKICKFITQKKTANK